MPFGESPWLGGRCEREQPKRVVKLRRPQQVSKLSTPFDLGRSLNCPDLDVVCIDLSKSSDCSQGTVPRGGGWGGGEGRRALPSPPLPPAGAADG